MSSWRLRILAIVIVFALAGAGFALFGSSTEVHRSEMSRLVVHTSGLTGVPSKPYLDKPQSFTSVPSKTLAQAAANDPGRTGVYTVGWKNSASSENVGLLIELLPTASAAKSARSELEKEYATKKSYQAAGLTFVGSFSVPKVPGAFAREFTTTATSTSSSPTTVETVLFQVRRVAVSVMVQSVKSADLRQGVSQLAASEMALLQRTEPDFVMTTSVHRALTALWYGLGALGVSLGIIFGPMVLFELQLNRERRAERAVRREQRHVNARGGKVLKRKSVPAWQASRSAPRRYEQWFRSRH